MDQTKNIECSIPRPTNFVLLVSVFNFYTNNDKLKEIVNLNLRDENII